jgi:hypothetical protein
MPESLTSGSSNTAIGSSALSSLQNGSSNTALGTNALGASTAGNQLTAVGAFALQNNSTGSSNLALGYKALSSMTTGNTNIGIGPSAGAGIQSGSNNICISGGNALGSTDSKNIAIGHSGVSGDSGAIRLGTRYTNTFCSIQGISGVTTSGAASAVLIDATGNLGTVNGSSLNDIQNVRPLEKESEGLLDLQPVTFSLKNDSTYCRQYGLVAEHVAKTMPHLVSYKQRNGKEEPEGVSYDKLSILLLRELIKTKKEIQTLSNNLQALTKKIQTST